MAQFPMFGGRTPAVAKWYGIPPAGDSSGGRIAAVKQTVRQAFVIRSDKTILLMIAYPITTGHNVDEILHVIDRLRLTAKDCVATPVNWTFGLEVIIAGSVRNDEDNGFVPKVGPGPRHVRASCRNPD